MSEQPLDNTDQIAFWNGRGGDLWVRRQVVQDRMFAELSARLDAVVDARPGDRILDVGCGTGTTSLSWADKVGAAGHVLGIDVSAPMLALARQRAGTRGNITFLEADATDHAFAPATIDIIASRFGVMFFADPVLAFTNLRSALRPGGRLAFVCWQEPKQNPWMMMPLMAAYEHVPKLPPVPPGAPGPFGFADADHVARLLGAAGFAGIVQQPQTFLFDIANAGGLDAAVAAAMEFGPTARALDGQPPEAVAAATASIRAALTPHLAGDTVRLPGAVRFVTAHLPA
jgi:SAM-dependent methyltransferase